MGIVFLALLGVVLIITVLFVNLSPQFGRSATSEQKKNYEQSKNYAKGKFINQIPTKMDIKFFKMLKEWFKNDPSRNPIKEIPTHKINVSDLKSYTDSLPRLTWFGHSAFLLEMDEQIILIDPMFGQYPSPHPMLGPKRYSTALPIEVDQLPTIDAVIFSHDHYDHLDYGTIKNIHQKVRKFYVPLAVGNHLRSWGVDPDKIEELDWWDMTLHDHIQLICTPARHFSGRGLFDRQTTLWSSWVIQGKTAKIYFSGDGGYGPHFKEIGEKYGPFDISLMECGQYNEDWHAIHMMPEETAQAAADLKSELFMPIHWGAFTLAFHSWVDPVVRVTKKAEALQIPCTTPKIGEPIIINTSNYPKSEWWKEYQVP